MAHTGIILPDDAGDQWDLSWTTIAAGNRSAGFPASGLGEALEAGPQR